MAHILFLVLQGVDMKPRLMDRLLTICLCSALVLCLWCLFLAYDAHGQTSCIF